MTIEKLHLSGGESFRNDKNLMGLLQVERHREASYHQSPDLLGELLLTQFIECVELPAENLVVTETCTGQFDPHDDSSVRDHHGDRAELDLQVLRQLLTTGVTRVLENQEELCGWF